MRKYLFLLSFIALTNAMLAQIQVKEGSFHKIQGYVMLDKEDHVDVNDAPMALIKISTENITAEQRRKFTFKGNLITYFDVKFEPSEIYLYITAEAATFLEIHHPDYGKTEYWLPQTLEPYCGYEMVVQRTAIEPEYGSLFISSEPDGADIYLDGKQYGKTDDVINNLTDGTHILKLVKEGYSELTKNITITKGETLKLKESLQSVSSQRTYLIVKADQADARIYIDDELINTGEASKSVMMGTTHTYKIVCDMYHEENGTVTINERKTIEKILRPNFGYINVTTTPEQDAKVFVDGKYLGQSPIKSDRLKSGTHTVMVMKEMFKMKEQSFTVTDGQTTNATLNMASNFVTLTIDTDTDSDIYIDEEYKGKGRWTGRLSDGMHTIEARKQNHRTTQKTLDLVLGENKTITLGAPTPINGSIDVNTSPMGATIYIDGKNYGETPNYINEIIIGTHELKLEKQGCTTITKTINIKEGETLNINEKLQTGKEITIKTDKSGDRIYVDGNYVGLSPITSPLSFGSHEIKAERDGKTVSKNIEVSHVETHGRVSSDEYVLTFTQEINGHEYVDLGLSVKWATCNVGASSPEDYGDYFAWGETKTKSEYNSDNSVTYGKKISDIKGNVRYDAARANWGGTWRLPTKTEFEELKNKCTWQWTTQNGKNGYKITGPNGNHIFLPAAGFRYESSLYDGGYGGRFWSSTPDDHSFSAYRLNVDSGEECVNYDTRGYGLTVRPVSE